MIIDGAKIAEEILESLKEKRKNYDKLKIAAFLIGKDKEKITFLKIKQKFAKELNIEFRIYELDENLSKRKIRKYVGQILKHKTIQGAIFQLPIPVKYPTQYLLNSIPAKKDIDCLSSKLMGKFYTNSAVISPPAVEVVNLILNKYQISILGKNILVIGYGRLIGKPISHYFANQKATVVIAQEETKLNEYLDKADIIISGVGKANLITDCKKNAILIDFGYSFKNSKAYGDIDFEKVKNKAAIVTPTPGGTGPILVAKLFENFFKLLDFRKVI
jgi:methylenetetrahydrofolate dehydrogenase (NADP+)/methenyltetrahydrofolate cyclohydrolase